MHSGNLFYQGEAATPVVPAPPLAQLKKPRPNFSLHLLRQRCWREEPPAVPAATVKLKKSWEAECDALAIIREEEKADQVCLVGFKGAAEVFSVRAGAVVEVENSRDVKAAISKSGKTAVSFAFALGSAGSQVIVVEYDTAEEKRAITQFASQLKKLCSSAQSPSSERPQGVPTRAQLKAELEAGRTMASPKKKKKMPADKLADSSFGFNAGYVPTQPNPRQVSRADQTLNALVSGQRRTEHRYASTAVAGRPGQQTIHQGSLRDSAPQRYEKEKAAQAAASAPSSPPPSSSFSSSSFPRSSASIGTNSFRSWPGSSSSSAPSSSSSNMYDVLNDAASFSPSHRDDDVRLKAPSKPRLQLLSARTGGSSSISHYGTQRLPSTTSNSFSSQYDSKPPFLSSSSHSSSFFSPSSSLSGRPRHSGDEIGMRNVGNNCWLIAVVQALFAQRAFTASLQRPLPVPLPPRCLYSSLLQLLTQHGEKGHGVLDPLPLKRAVGERLQRFAGSRQQDAHEFLMEALNAVTEDIVDAFVRHWRRQTAPTAVSADTKGHSGAMLVESALTEARSRAMTPPPPSSRPVSSPLLAPLPPRSRTEDDAVSVGSGGSDKENRSPPPPPLPLPPPPVELLKVWQQQADRLSASHSSFHCEVEVTLTCRNADCRYSRKNVEHFNVLSLDLPEPLQTQTSLDGWMRPAASAAAAASSLYGSSSAASLPSRSPPTASSSSSSSSFASSPSHQIPDLPLYLSNCAANHSTGSLLSNNSSGTASASSASSSSSSSSWPHSSPASSSSFSSSLSSSSSALSSSASSRAPSARSAVSMVSLLRQFFSPMHQEYKCERCQHEEVEITSAISRLPRVLILHIKRFTPDQRSGTYEKRQDPVLVQRTIDVAFACKDDVELPEMDQQLDAALAPLPAAAAAEESRRSVSPAENGWDDDHAMVEETAASSRSSPRATTAHSSGSSSPSPRLDSAASASRVSVSPPAVSPSSSAAAVLTPGSASSKRSRVAVDGASPSLLSPSSASAAAAQSDSDPDSARKRTRVSPSQFSSVKRDKWAEMRVQIELEFRSRQKTLQDEYQRLKESRGGIEEYNVDYEYCIRCSELTAEEENRKAEVEREEKEARQKEEERESRRRAVAAAERRRKAEAEQRRQKELAAEAEQGGAAEAEDEVLKRVLEESKQEAEKPHSSRTREEEQLQAAITASMQEQKQRALDDDNVVSAALASELPREPSSASLPPQPLPALPGSPQQQPATPTSIATTVSPLSDASMPSCPQSPQSKSASPPPPASSSSPSSSSARSCSRAVYSLRGLVLHKGESSSSGHYIADLLLPEAGGEGGGKQAVWKRFDDQWVDTLKVEEERTRRTWEKEGYILFFQLLQQRDDSSKTSAPLPLIAAV